MVRKITYIDLLRLYLTDYSRRYYLRELADLLKKPHQTIKPYLESLVKEKVLIKYERKNITEYGLNFKNNRIYDYLTVAEKDRLNKRLTEDTLLEILFEKLSAAFNKNFFVIFGSSVIKTQKNSDIDLLVIGSEDVDKIIDSFQEVYNKLVHKIQVKKLNGISLALIKEIYKKHLILNNTESVVRYFGELYEQNKLV